MALFTKNINFTNNSDYYFLKIVSLKLSDQVTELTKHS